MCRPTGTCPRLQDLAEGWRIWRSHRVLVDTLVLTFTLNVVSVRAPLSATTAGRGASDYVLFEGLCLDWSACQKLGKTD